MIRRTMWVALFVGSLITIIPISVNAQSSPGNTVRAFYKWYVHALNRNIAEPLKSDRASARKYVTASLLRRIEKAMAKEDGLDADYFLSAQDWDKDWENNIVIGKASTTGATSIVNVVLQSKTMGDHK